MHGDGECSAEAIPSKGLTREERCVVSTWEAVQSDLWTEFKDRFRLLQLIQFSAPTIESVVVDTLHRPSWCFPHSQNTKGFGLFWGSRPQTKLPEIRTPVREKAHFSYSTYFNFISYQQNPSKPLIHLISSSTHPKLQELRAVRSLSIPRCSLVVNDCRQSLGLIFVSWFNV